MPQECSCEVSDSVIGRFTLAGNILLKYPKEK